MARATTEQHATSERPLPEGNAFRRVLGLACGVWALWWAEAIVLSPLHHHRSGIRMWSHWDAPHFMSIVRDG